MSSPSLPGFPGNQPAQMDGQHTHQFQKEILDLLRANFHEIRDLGKSVQRNTEALSNVTQRLQEFSEKVQMNTQTLKRVEDRIYNYNNWFHDRVKTIEGKHADIVTPGWPVAPDAPIQRLGQHH